MLSVTSVSDPSLSLSDRYCSTEPTPRRSDVTHQSPESRRSHHPILTLDSRLDPGHLNIPFLMLQRQKMLFWKSHVASSRRRHPQPLGISCFLLAPKKCIKYLVQRVYDIYKGSTPNCSITNNSKQRFLLARCFAILKSK